MIRCLGRRHRSRNRNTRKKEEDRLVTTIPNQRRSGKSHRGGRRDNNIPSRETSSPPLLSSAATTTATAATITTTNHELPSERRAATARLGREAKDAVVRAALSIEEIVERVIGYLPSKQQQRVCPLVSKLWKRVVTESKLFPLVLCIEAARSNHNHNHNHNHHTNRRHPRRTKHNRGRGSNRNRDRSRNRNGTKLLHGDEDDGENENDEVFLFPLQDVGNLPPAVAARTTKLILVLKFLREHASGIDLNDFCFCEGRPCPFLRRFTNLQDLTIVSEYAADQFVSILGPPPPSPSASAYEDEDRLRIPSLRRIHYEETNASNWRSSTLRAFVEIAPNLEILVLRENILRRWDLRDPLFPAESLADLLPLAGSLRELVLFNRHNLRGNFVHFLERMPLLDSWDVFCFGISMGRWPVVCGKESYQTFEDNAYRGVNVNEPSHFVELLKDETEFLLTLQEMVVSWFLKLDDPNLHPWRTRIPTMVGYLDALVWEYFEGRFYEHRPERPHTLPSLRNLLEVTDASPPTASLSSSPPLLPARPVVGHKYSGYCTVSKRETQRRNFYRVVRPCMEVYQREFLYYTDVDRYNVFQVLRQRWQLKRLVRRISLVGDRYRCRAAWFEATPERDGFDVLV
eukprot:jgi/Psemu1/30445/gm1.30445_g